MPGTPPDILTPSSFIPFPILELPGTVWLASDLHLCEEMPATREAFLAFLEMAAHDADSLLLVGDLFDAWVGDDVIDAAPPWLAEVIAGLRTAADRIPVYLGTGNRDFLIGDRFAAATGTHLLAEPSVVRSDAGRFLLCHGDGLCTDDVAYQQFRAMVRNPAWQAQFLSRSLPERQAIARDLRAKSVAEKSRKAADIMDVNADTVAQCLRDAGVTKLVHGHTHRPDRHVFLLDEQRAERWVLPDWDLDDAEAPRGGWLVADRDGFVFNDIESEG